MRRETGKGERNYAKHYIQGALCASYSYSRPQMHDVSSSFLSLIDEVIDRIINEQVVTRCSPVGAISG